MEKQLVWETAGRDENGRFLPNQLLQREAREKGREGIRRRKERNHALFKRYINAFFITGGERDFVPFSSKSGPFVLTYEKIMKPTFAIGRTKRSGILKGFYDDQGLHGIPSKIARITTRDFRFPKGKSSRVDVYRYRRMSSLTSQGSELERLKAFLKHAENENSLAFSKEEAYTICCKAMGTYQNARGKMAYIGFPVVGLQNRVSSSSSTCTVDDRLRNEVSDNRNDDAVEHSRHGKDDSDCEEPQSSIETNAHETSSKSTCTTLHEGDNQLFPPIRVHPSPRSAKYFRQAVQFLKLARSNSIFEVLNKSLDDRDSKFHFTAIPFAVPSLGEPKVPNVLKDTLTHCQGRVFVTKNQNELQRIEANLREVKEEFGKVRKIYAMKNVKDMNWSFD